MTTRRPQCSEGAAVRRPSASARRSLRPARLLGLLALLACASPGIPPGGPPDKQPPKLLAVVPESGTVNTLPRSVIFRFDEVVNERPTGANSLDDMFLVSPRPRELDVEWNREEIWVRPSGGWRKNLVYTITMLPGMSDLRGNVLKEGRTVVFGTGDAIPDTRVSGVLFDWAKGTPAVRAVVEAVDRRDTTIQYVGLTDSLGRFTIRHLPPAGYLMRAAVGTASAVGGGSGGLRAFDRRRAWDSLGVSLTDSVRVELLAFMHDTLGPRVSQLTVRDSVTLKLTLDQPVLVTQLPGRDNFTLLARDSSTVFVDSVFTAEAFAAWEKKAADSAAATRRDSTTRRDSAARADSARRAPPPAAGAPAARPGRVTTPNAANPAVTPAVTPSVTPSVTPATPDANARPDSTRDSTRRVLPKPSQPSPITEFVIRLGAPLAPQSTYRLALKDIRGLLGASRPSDRAFSTPKAPSKDSTAKAAPGANAPLSAPTTRPPPGFTPAAPRDTTKPPPKPPAAGNPE